MSLAEGARKPVGGLRREHEVDVVGHQAIRPHLDRGLAALLREQVAIERVIGRREEHGLTAVAALGHVMRMARNDNARHGGIVVASDNRCNG